MKKEIEKLSQEDKNKIKQEILFEYEMNKQLCKKNWIGFEKHNNNERLDFSEDYVRIRFDIYTDLNYRNVRKLFPNYEILKSNKKTIGKQNQYLISYKYKIKIGN